MKKVIHQKITYSIDQLDTVVAILKSAMQTCSVITLSGPLGAGKTTLAREFLKSCGIKGVISSPTFTYVNYYGNDQGYSFYHFDLYRISSRQEFENAGFDEYLYQPNSLVIIEWPEVISELLTHDVCTVTLCYQDDSNERHAEITYSE